MVDSEVEGLEAVVVEVGMAEEVVEGMEEEEEAEEASVLGPILLLLAILVMEEVVVIIIKHVSSLTPS